MGQLLLSIPIFLVLSVLQTVAVSRIRIISGFGDIILLAIASWIIIDEDGNYLAWAIIAGFLISILSALPISATFLIYIFTALIAKIASRIFWQSPILALFSSALVATLVKFIIEFLTLQFSNIQVPFQLSVTSILLPTLLLNLFYAFPIYILMGDVSGWFTAKEDDYA